MLFCWRVLAWLWRMNVELCHFMQGLVHDLHTG
jgi:hypothetical protein